MFDDDEEEFADSSLIEDIERFDAIDFAVLQQQREHLPASAAGVHRGVGLIRPRQAMDREGQGFIGCLGHGRCVFCAE